GREQRAGERQALEEAELEERDADRQEQRDRRPQGRPGRRAQHVRICQRVAEQALERRARDRQSGPDDHRREDSRQAQLPDDRLGRGGPGRAQGQPEQAVGDDRERVAGRDRDRPQADAQDERAHEREDPDQGQHDRPAADAPGPPDVESGGDERAAAGGHPPCQPPGGIGESDGTGASGWIVWARSWRPSISRGPGRVTVWSSIGRMSPFFTAVMTLQPGRAATWSFVTPNWPSARRMTSGSSEMSRSTGMSNLSFEPVVTGSAPARWIISARNDSSAGP